MSQKNQAESFSIIDKLAQTLKEQDLSFISYKSDSFSVKLARRLESPQGSVSSFSQVVSPVVDSQPQSPSPPAPDRDESKIIRSGLVGVVYLAHSPGAEPFIKHGDNISKGTVVLIIEAMKVMNQITAPCDGKIESILVGDGEPVEYDQPLIYLV